VSVSDPAPSRPHVLVLGAGALGLACAAVLTRRGAAVSVLDPGGANASSVAAGMVAPAFEAAVEDADAARAALYRTARDRWPGFADAFAIDLDRSGARWVGDPAPLLERMRALGFSVEATAEGFVTDEDWLVDPGQALEALRRSVERGGGRLLAGRAAAVMPEADGLCVRTAAGDALEADAVVLAAGWAAGRIAVAGLEPMLAAIGPIRGQIVELEATPGAPAGVVRAQGVYLIPRAGRVLAGATMEAGEVGLEPDPAISERLRLAAVAAVPALAGAAPVAARVGVRGASPDGLPMAGATGVPGIAAALAPRRNGWLFAPLVAEIVAAAVFGKDAGPEGEALRPDRFRSRG
jgi:glycine oxidase